MSRIQYDKINPKFRHLTDMLLFSQETDIDVSEFKILLKENQGLHRRYFLNRFDKSVQIFWEDGKEFWYKKLSFIFSLNDKLIIRNISLSIEKRMKGLVKNYRNITTEDDLELLQYNQFCKVKFDNHRDLTSIKTYLLKLSEHVNNKELIPIIKEFFPFVFLDIKDFTNLLIKGIPDYTQNIDLLLYIESTGIYIDKKKMALLAIDLFTRRKQSHSSRRSFYLLINNPEILALIKNKYSPKLRPALIKMLESTNSQMFLSYKSSHNNIINIIMIDPQVANKAVEIYIRNLYFRYTTHKKANTDAIIKMLKDVNEITPKNVLLHLPSKDVRYFLEAFPELKKISLFI